MSDRKAFLSIWLPTFAIDRLREATGRHVDGQVQSAVPKNRPFALVISGRHGLTITAVNDHAHKEGISIGQTLADARAAIPQLITQPAEPERDHARLYALAHAAGRYGPARNVEGEDGLWIDSTGVTHLFGSEEALARDCVRRFKRAGYRTRVGMAGTPAAAFALARYGEGFASRCSFTPHDADSSGGMAFQSGGLASAETRQTDRPVQHTVSSEDFSDKQRLSNLSVEALRLEPQTIVLLKRLGLRRIGQLYNLPRAVLARRFRDLRIKGAGRAGQRESLAQAVLLRLDQALGQLSDPRQPLTEPPVFMSRRSYPDMLITSEGIETACTDLAGELCDALAAHHKGARRLRFSLYRADGSVADAVIGTSQPCRKPGHLITLFRDKLNALDAGFGIDMIALEALQVDTLEETQSRLTHRDDIIDGAQAQANTAVLIDRLSNRLGRKTVFQLAHVESHIPERAQRRAFDFPSVNEDRQVSARKRPPFLLTAPEKITVIAEVPEGPPARFTWRRVMHCIVKAEGPERIAPEWWRRLNLPASHCCSTASAETQPIDQPAMLPVTTITPTSDQNRIRDYYTLEDDSGMHYWVFRSGLYQLEAENGPPTWYMHGLFG